MNSGTTSTKLNDMLTEFVDYVYSFYGDKKDALYPLFNVDTDKQVDKVDILSAVYDYLHEITRRNDDHFTWGDVGRNTASWIEIDWTASWDNLSQYDYVECSDGHIFSNY